MRAMPPARATIPAIRAIRAIVARCGILTSNSDIVATPRLPSAFITTTRQLPSRTFQSSAAVLPADSATQNDWVAGGLGLAVPRPAGVWGGAGPPAQSGAAALAGPRPSRP